MRKIDKKILNFLYKCELYKAYLNKSEKSSKFFINKNNLNLIN